MYKMRNVQLFYGPAANLAFVAALIITTLWVLAVTRTAPTMRGERPVSASPVAPAQTSETKTAEVELISASPIVGC